MKNTIALVALLSLGSAIPSTRAEVSVEFFYESLEPHGEWLDVGDYGYVWHPRDVDEDWRPYTVGQWAYTDAGWTWVSEEPHGWATHHYGRWVNAEPTGWVWVPGVEWGPAWVSWRRSERHVGWAPLPPEASFRVNFSIGNWADSYYDIGPANYSFVETRHLGSPRIRTVVLPPRENITIIRETRNITNITYRNNIVINEGPVYDEITRVSAEPIRRLRLDRRTDIRDVQAVDSYRTRVQGDSLSIAAPTVIYNKNVAPKRVARKVTNVQVNRGWRGEGVAPQEMERMRTAVRQEAKPPAELPPQPKFEREERSSTATSDATATERPGTGRAGRPGSTATNAPGATSTTPDATAKKPGTDATATTPGSTTTTEPNTATPGTDAAKKPGMRAGRPDGQRTTDAPGTDTPGRPGRAVRPDATTPDATTPGTKPDSTTPSATTPPADKPAKPDATTPGATTRPGRSDAPGSTSTPDSPDRPNATRPGRANRPDASAEDKPARPGSDASPDAVDRPGRSGRAGRPESPGASATPGSPDPATTGRPEAPGRSNPVNRPESPGRSDKPGRAESDSDAGRPGSKRPDASTSPANTDRPDRPERPNRPDASERPSRSESPTRPEAAKRPDAPTRPERPDRPAQAERPQQPERPAQAERPAAAQQHQPAKERPPTAQAAAKQPGAAGADSEGDGADKKKKKNE